MKITGHIKETSSGYTAESRSSGCTKSGKSFVEWNNYLLDSWSRVSRGLRRVMHSAWIFCEVSRINTLLSCTTQHLGWHLCLALKDFSLTCVLLLCYVAFSLRNIFEIYQAILQYKMDCTQGICNLVSFCDSLSVYCHWRRLPYGIRIHVAEMFSIKIQFCTEMGIQIEWKWSKALMSTQGDQLGCMRQEPFRLNWTL